MNTISEFWQFVRRGSTDTEVFDIFDIFGVDDTDPMVCPGMLQNTYFIPLEGRGVEYLNDSIFGVLTVLATYS